MKELITQLYIMYITVGKLVLCVFDKVSCSLRAEMPEKLHKKTIKNATTATIFS